MPARGRLGRLDVLAASDLAFSLRVKPVPYQCQPTALQSQQVARSAAGVDPAWADRPPPATLVFRKRFPEVIPVGADEHQHPAVPEFGERGLQGTVVVAVAAEVDDLVAVPRLAVVVGVVGTDLMPPRVAEKVLHGHGDPAGTGLDHVDQRATVAVKYHLAVDPGLSVVETADRPDVQLDVGGGGSRGVVPAPLVGRLIREDDDDRARLRPHGDAVPGNARLGAGVDRFRLRPGLAGVGRGAGRIVLEA